jgi:hypothetical protein
VIFLFKYPTDEKPRNAPLDGEFDYAALESPEDSEGPVWFAAQTIQNACGTQALLAVLLNKDGAEDEGGVDIGPSLREFKEFTSAFPSEVSRHDFGRDTADSILIAAIPTDPRRSPLQLRPHPRDPQQLRALLSFRLR